MKTTHGGAKNGGGYWGTRREAKTVVKRIGRKEGKMTTEENAYYDEYEKANLVRGFCPDGCCGPDEDENLITLNVSPKILEELDLD